MAVRMVGFPSHIRGYALRRHIASGGMADVFEATHPTTGRRVAVKLMKEELRSKPTGRARFSREVRTIAMLSHSNIVRIVDAGETDAGDPFLVMDYIDGVSLRQVLEQQQVVDPQRASIIALQVARALAYAHRGGVVHRDLKPENILLQSSPDTTEHVVLIDFGVSRVCGDESAEACLTSNGTLLGTANYMSPEQARGESTLSTATDCYALGAIIYEMLSGERAHQGDTRQSVLHHVMYHRVKPLAPASTRQFPELRNLIGRCLDKRKDGRPQATEIISVLERALDPNGALLYRSSMDTLATAPTPSPFMRRPTHYVAGFLLAASCGWGILEVVVESASGEKVPGPVAEGVSELTPARLLPHELLANHEPVGMSNAGDWTNDSISNSWLSAVETSLCQQELTQRSVDGLQSSKRALAPRVVRRQRVERISALSSIPQEDADGVVAEGDATKAADAAPPPNLLARPLQANPYAARGH